MHLLKLTKKQKLAVKAHNKSVYKKCREIEQSRRQIAQFLERVAAPKKSK